MLIISHLRAIVYQNRLCMYRWKFILKKVIINSSLRSMVSLYRCIFILTPNFWAALFNTIRSFISRLKTLIATNLWLTMGVNVYLVWVMRLVKYSSRNIMSNSDFFFIYLFFFCQWCIKNDSTIVSCILECDFAVLFSL